MRLLGSGKGGVVAIAGFCERHLQGYAVRTPDGWICIAALGMTWSKLRASTADDARITLRTTCHASRFESFENVDDLVVLIDTIPPHQQPGILPQHICGVPVKLPKLVS